MNTTRTLLILSALALAGCDSKTERTVSAASAPEASVAASAPEAPVVSSNVVIVVGDEQLTKEDLAAYSDFVCQQRLRGITPSAAEYERFRVKFANQRVQTFAGARLLCKEAQRRGLAYDQRQYERRIARYSKLPEATRQLAGQLIDEDMTIAELRKQLLAAEPPIEQQKIERCLKRIATHNEMASKTNATSLAELGDLRRRIVGGEGAFEDIATQESEDEWIAESGCEWGTFQLSELEDEEALLKVLPAMKLGDITEPIECDCGYAIVRLDSVDGGAYTLSRIFRRRMVTMDEETAEQLQVRFRQENAEKRLNALVEELLKATPPKYPNGDFLETTVKTTNKEAQS